MSGYGHMAELSKRTKTLDALRKERLKNHKKRSTSYSTLKIEFDFKKVSPEELRVIKQKIQEKFKKNV